MSKYLVIAGVSGSGKSVLTDNLVKDYPEYFIKMEQLTTRKKRDTDTDDTYVFIKREEDFLKLNHLLIGRTHFNGNHYGSIPLPENEKRVGIIILNEEGLKDFLENTDKNKDSIYVLGLDKCMSDIIVEREGRDGSILNKEKQVLILCDLVLWTPKDVYVKTSEVFELVFEGLELLFDDDM